MIEPPNNFDPLFEQFKQLNVPDIFLKSLLKDDDWSVVIKLNSLIEASITHLISKKFGEESLIEVLSYLDLADKRKGKIAFVKALDLIEKKQRQFVHTVATLRNRLVHDIRNVDFEFKNYIENLDKEKRSTFVDGLGALLVDQVGEGNSAIPKEEFVLENPRITIMAGTFSLIIRIYGKMKEIKYEKEQLDLAADMVKKIEQLSKSEEK